MSTRLFNVVYVQVYHLLVSLTLLPLTLIEGSS